MALGFLNTIGKVAGGVSPIVKLLSEMRGQKQTAQAIKGTNIPSEAEKYATGMYQALAQPDNALIKSLSDEEYRNLMSAYSSGIQEKVLADRRERAMGRAPVFFDPERADENINYQLTRGAPQLAQQARENAIQRIMKAASGTSTYAAPQAERLKTTQQVKKANIAASSQIPTDILNILRGFGGGQQSPQYSQQLPSQKRY